MQILAGGSFIKEYLRDTRESLLIYPMCYEGDSTDRVVAPRPLGRMGLRLKGIADLPVQARPINFYGGLAEAARCPSSSWLILLV